VLHIFIDNVKLGAYTNRKPNGYWRFQVADPKHGPYRVSMRTSIYDAVLRGNVTNVEGDIITNFTLFVNADLSLPVPSSCPDIHQI